MTAPPVHVKPLPVGFSKPPEILTGDWVEKWIQVHQRLLEEVEQAGGYTVDMLLAERCATIYTLAIMRDSEGVIPPEEATRTYPKLDDDGKPVLNDKGEPVMVVEEFMVQRGWDHIRNQKESMQLWTSMVSQLRNNMLPDVAAARTAAFDMTMAMCLQAFEQVKNQMPLEFADGFMQKIYDALAGIDKLALFKVLEEQHEAEKRAVPGGKKARR